MDFSVGQRVVCVDVNFSHEPLWRSCVRAFPRRGSIYTIRNIRAVDDLVGVCLHEIVNSWAYFAEGYVEAAFHSRKFRPVRATNIDVLRALLTSAPASPRDRYAAFPL
jgi:hypothetical protein